MAAYSLALTFLWAALARRSAEIDLWRQEATDQPVTAARMVAGFMGLEIHKLTDHVVQIRAARVADAELALVVMLDIDTALGSRGCPRQIDARTFWYVIDCRECRTGKQH